MKITLCGSIAFYDKMQETKDKLEELGHEVKLPPSDIEDENGNLMPVLEYYKIRKEASDDDSWILDTKEEAMRNHFNKVDWADVVLILNYNKNDIEGYIGANTLLEMGLAFHLGKKIYILNQIPEISYKEEILGMKPEIIDSEFNF